MIVTLKNINFEKRLWQQGSRAAEWHGMLQQILVVREGSRQFRNVWEAVEGGSVESVRIFLDKTPTLISEKDWRGVTLLLKAIDRQDQEMVAFLLNYHDCNVNARTPWGATALHIAVRGNSQIVSLLVDKGADVTAKDEEAKTALWYATMYKNVAVMDILLHKLSGEDKDEVLNLRSVIQSDRSIQNLPLHFVIQNGSDEPPHARSRTQEGSLECVRVLLQHGADPNVVDKNNNTALRIALLSQRSKEIVEALLEKGALLTAVDGDGNGETPLHYSSYSLDVTALLITKGADLNVQDSLGRTPLHCSIHSPAVTQLLIAKGAKLDVKDNVGCTPLHYAVKAWSAAVAVPAVKVLLHAGADRDIQNHAGQKPSECIPGWYFVYREQQLLLDALQTPKAASLCLIDEIAQKDCPVGVGRLQTPEDTALLELLRRSAEGNREAIDLFGSHTPPSRPAGTVPFALHAGIAQTGQKHPRDSSPAAGGGPVG